MLVVIVGAVALVAGFGLGRVKNASKLSAVSAELAKVQASASADVKALVASIKAKL